MDKGIELLLQKTNTDFRDLKRDVKEDFNLVRQDIAALRTIVESLNYHKGVSLGVVSGISAVFAVITTLLTLYLTHK